MPTIEQNQSPGAAKIGPFSRRVWTTVAIAAVVVVALFIIWQALEILLAIFMGIIFAAFLDGVSRFTAAHTPLPRKVVLFTVLALIVAGLLLIGFLAVPTIDQQVSQFNLQLDESLETLTSEMQQSTVGSLILRLMPDAQGAGGSGLTSQVFSRVGGVFSSTFDMLTRVVLIIFVGIYLAYEPSLYINGVVKLAPHKYRERFRRLISEVVFTLQRWLAGQFVAMAIIGVLATVGLWLLGMPLAFLLGFLAGLLEFVPILGTLVASVIPILLAFTVSTQTAIYVAILFITIQAIEGNIITPLIQKKAVRLPPALLLASQVLLGLFAGLIGVAVAAPLTVTLMVAVKMLYVEGVLDDHSVEYLSHSSDGTERVDETHEKQHSPL